MTLVQKALEYFGTQPEDPFDLVEREKRIPTTWHIWQYMMEKCRTEENYYPGENIMRKYVVEVLVKVGTDCSWRTYVKDSFDRAFPIPWERRN